jgi:hypothetical protein
MLCQSIFIVVNNVSNPGKTVGSGTSKKRTRFIISDVMSRRPAGEKVVRHISIKGPTGKAILIPAYPFPIQSYRI